MHSSLSAKSSFYFPACRTASGWKQAVTPVNEVTPAAARPGRSSFISRELKAGGKAYVYVRLERSFDPLRRSPWTACLHISDSYPLDVSHLSFNVLCLLLLYVSISGIISVLLPPAFSIICSVLSDPMQLTEYTEYLHQRVQGTLCPHPFSPSLSQSFLRERIVEVWRVAGSYFCPSWL